MILIEYLTKFSLINLFFLLINLIEFNECRRPLRDYLIINSSRNPNRIDSSSIIKTSFDSFSIYDNQQEQQQLLCQLNSFNSYSYRFTQLINYPLKQTIASVEYRWLTFGLRNSLMMIYDDQYDQWFQGSIIEQIKSQQIEFELEYLNQFYRMEIKPLTFIVEIRQLNRTNLLLSRFVPQIKLNQEQFHQSFKYQIEIYTNRLPDPFYFLAFDHFYSYFQRISN